MLRHSSLFLISLCSLWAMSGNAQPKPPPDLSWDLDRFVALGQGCRGGEDTAVSARENSLSSTFTNFLFDLSHTSELLSDRVACSLRVPVSVPANYYVSEIKFKLTAKVLKSPDAGGSVVLSAGFYGLEPLQATHEFLRNVSDPALDLDSFELEKTVKVEPDSQWYKEFCRTTRTSETIFALNVAVSGERNSTEERFVFDLRKQNGGDVSVTSVLSPCVAE